MEVKFLKRLFIILPIIAIVSATMFLVFTMALDDEAAQKVEQTLRKIEIKLGVYKDSGITGEGLEFDKEFYPYFHFLSEDGQKLYRQVYANAKELEKTFVPVVEMKSSEVSNVVSAVYHDHPELFWFDGGFAYQFNEEEICVQLTLHFNEAAENIEEYREDFEEKAKSLIQKAKTKPSDYGMEKYVYNYIIGHTQYDTTASMHQSPYSALVLGRSVCAGYARAFQYILIELGIPTYYCTGEAEGHAWNIVKLEDGYYNVDLTMANKHAREGAFLNRTDKEVSGTHKRSGYSTLLPKCTAVKYKSDSQ